MTSISSEEWPGWLGIGGRDRSESVAALNRNRWPPCIGMRRVVGEAGYRASEAMVAGPSEFDAPGLSGGVGDGADAGLGGEERVTAVLGGAREAEDKDLTGVLKNPLVLDTKAVVWIGDANYRGSRTEDLHFP